MPQPEGPTRAKVLPDSKVSFSGLRAHRSSWAPGAYACPTSTMSSAAKAGRIHRETVWLGTTRQTQCAKAMQVAPLPHPH